LSFSRSDLFIVFNVFKVLVSAAIARPPAGKSAERARVFFEQTPGFVAEAPAPFGVKP
jgi:hypothetical protein